MAEKSDGVVVEQQPTTNATGIRAVLAPEPTCYPTPLTRSRERSALTASLLVRTAEKMQGAALLCASRATSPPPSAPSSLMIESCLWGNHARVLRCNQRFG